MQTAAEKLDDCINKVSKFFLEDRDKKFILIRGVVYRMNIPDLPDYIDVQDLPSLTRIYLHVPNFERAKEIYDLSRAAEVMLPHDVFIEVTTKPPPVRTDENGERKSIFFDPDAGRWHERTFDKPKDFIDRMEIAMAEAPRLQRLTVAWDVTAALATIVAAASGPSIMAFVTIFLWGFIALWECWKIAKRNHFGFLSENKLMRALSFLAYFLPATIVVMSLSKVINNLIG